MNSRVCGLFRHVLFVFKTGFLFVDQAGFHSIALILLWSLSWPGTFQIDPANLKPTELCLCLLSAGTKDMRRQIWLGSTWLLNFFKKNISSIFICTSICQIMFVYHMHAESAAGRRRHYMPWNWDYKRLSCCFGAGNWTWVPGRARVTVLSHPLSPIASVIFFFLSMPQVIIMCSKNWQILV